MNMAVADRDVHRASCPNRPTHCPFAGCTETPKLADLDVHTFKCPFSKQYSVESLLASVATAQRASTLQDISELCTVFQKSEAGQASVGSSQTGGFRIHHVADGDTLAGIAIRYGTTKAEIKRLNRLTSDCIFSHATLRLPGAEACDADCSDVQPQYPPAEVVLALHRRRLLRQVMVATRLQSEEASSYLKMAHYDVPAAVTLAKADDDWARTHAFQPPRSLKEFIKLQQAQ